MFCFSFLFFLLSSANLASFLTPKGYAQWMTLLYCYCKLLTHHRWYPKCYSSCTKHWAFVLDLLGKFWSLRPWSAHVPHRSSPSGYSSFHVFSQTLGQAFNHPLSHMFWRILLERGSNLHCTVFLRHVIRYACFHFRFISCQKKFLMSTVLYSEIFIHVCKLLCHFQKSVHARRVEAVVLKSFEASK